MKQAWFEKVADRLKRKEAKANNGTHVRIILDRENQDPYLVRYYLLNLRPLCRVVIHQIIRSDVDGLHDHPWPYASLILKGGYWEQTLKGRFWRKPGHFRIRAANSYHRLEKDPKVDDVWTLFFMGPKIKEWGFKDENGAWVQWEEHLNNRAKKPKKRARKK